MSVPSILVTGANRGLGLEFCRQYVGAGWRVLACCRNPEGATELQSLAASHAEFEVYPLDVTDQQQVDRVSRQIADKSLDILLNNAGVYGDSSRHGFGALDYQSWLETLRINTLAPVMLTEAFLPQISRSDKKLIVSITSLMGSMADNQSGGCIAYRSSKAALNASMKSLAIDLKPKQIGVLILHPGWVKTRMGGKNAPMSAEQSISGMRRIVDNFRLRDSGKFFNYAGKLMSW